VQQGTPTSNVRNRKEQEGTGRNRSEQPGCFAQPGPGTARAVGCLGHPFAERAAVSTPGAHCCLYSRWDGQVIILVCVDWVGGLGVRACVRACVWALPSTVPVSMHIHACVCLLLVCQVGCCGVGGVSCVWLRRCCCGCVAKGNKKPAKRKATSSSKRIR